MKPALINFFVTRHNFVIDELNIIALKWPKDYENWNAWAWWVVFWCKWVTKIPGHKRRSDVFGTKFQNYPVPFIIVLTLHWPGRRQINKNCFYNKPCGSLWFLQMWRSSPIINEISTRWSSNDLWYNSNLRLSFSSISSSMVSFDVSADSFFESGINP